MKYSVILLAPVTAALLSSCVTVNIGTEEPIKAEIDMKLDHDLNLTADENAPKKEESKKDVKKKA